MLRIVLSASHDIHCPSLCSVVMRPPVWSLVLSAVWGMVRRGRMSDTEVAEIEDMLNTSQTEHVDHLEILNPPQSHIIHRHEALLTLES